MFHAETRVGAEQSHEAAYEQPAPTDSISASANCATTSDPSRRCRRAPACRASAFFQRVGRGTERLAARGRRRTRAASPARERLRGDDRRVESIDSARGSVSPQASSPCIVQYASSTPAAPPIAASTSPTVSSWRTTRAGLAPSADRTASSRCREPARVSIRFATSTQPMSSTMPTAPISTRSIRRLRPTMSSATATSKRQLCVLAWPAGIARRLCLRGSAPRVCWTETPGFSGR